MGVLDAQGAALADTVLPLLNAHGKRLDRLDGLIYAVDVNAIRVERLVDCIVGLTLTQRLRWLLTGRLP